MTYNSELHLSSLISEIIKIFSKHGYKELEEKLVKTVNDKHPIVSQEEFVTRNFVPNLEYSIKKRLNGFVIIIYQTLLTGLMGALPPFMLRRMRIYPLV